MLAMLGTAPLSAAPFSALGQNVNSITGSGGVYTNGASIPITAFSPMSSGGSYGTGQANSMAIYNPIASGGAYTNGAANSPSVYSAIASGGGYGTGQANAVEVNSPTGAGGAWVNGGMTLSYYITGSGGAFPAGVGFTTATLNAALGPGGGWMNGNANGSAAFNVSPSLAGVWVSDADGDQPAYIVPTLLGQSAGGLRCRFGLVFRYVTMVKIKDAYVAAITVCDSQIVLRKLAQRLR